MGKTKIKRRSKEVAVNPVGIPSIKELEKEEMSLEINFSTDDVECLLEKLQGSADDKECAAYTIANMASNPTFVASMIEKKAIRIAAPLLVDRTPSVRHAIAGSLRNLAVCGDHSVCQAMVDQDILTSLVTLLSEYRDPWSPSLSSDDIIDSKSEIFLEACNLLWSLCESSETAVAIFNEKKLVSILLPCLNITTFGLRIPLAVAQCLNTVGEENQDMCEEMLASQVQEQLRAMMAIEPEKPEHILLKTLAASIMMNTLAGKIQNCMNDVTNPIAKVTADALTEPINPVLSQLSDSITSHKHERTNKYHEEKDLENKLQVLNKTADTADYLLQAKQIALEILTNICFGDDPNDEWDNISSSDTSEEIVMDVDEVSVMPLKLGLEVSSEIHCVIMQHGMLQKVIDQIVIPSEEVTKVISENSRGKTVLKRLNTVRSRALLCLNNMVQSLTVDDVGGPTKLFELWMNIANLLFKQTDFTNTEQLEAATSSMRAVLQKLAEAKCSSQFNNLSGSDLELLMNICNETQESAVKVNVIRSLGLIGCLIGEPQLLESSHKLIFAIGVFLLEICSKSSDLWVIAESLDVLIDVFAEDHVDYIAQEINLVEKLQHLQKFLKGKVKQQRKFLGEHLTVIMTVKENLLRFIQYKIHLRKK